MATDATGTPTSLGIPKYNTSADAPSGLGFNAAMDSIDTLLAARVTKPAGTVSGEWPVWNGSTWVRSSTIAPPGTELAYQAYTTDQSTASTTLVDLFTFSAATFENTKHYLEIAIPALRSSAGSNYAVFQLKEGAANVGNPVQPFLSATASADTNVFMRIPFTPTAGAHTYKVQWNTVFAATLTVKATGSGDATFRIVKA